MYHYSHNCAYPSAIQRHTDKLFYALKNPPTASLQEPCCSSPIFLTASTAHSEQTQHHHVLIRPPRAPSAPYFDPSRSRTLCGAGIVVCWAAGLICLGFGIHLISTRGGDYPTWNKAARELLPLCLNVLVTFINEPLGYIHTNFLCRALQREGRLASTGI